MFYQLGCDITGTPKQAEKLYGCCCIAVPHERVDAISQSLSALRAKSGMTQDQEFHGHQMPEKMQLELLLTALKEDVQVFAHFVDKFASSQGKIDLPTPNVFPMHLLLKTIKPCLVEICVNRISIDEDIKGKQLQQQVRTALPYKSRNLGNHTNKSEVC